MISELIIDFIYLDKPFDRDFSAGLGALFYTLIFIIIGTIILLIETYFFNKKQKFYKRNGNLILIGILTLFYLILIFK